MKTGALDFGGFYEVTTIGAMTGQSVGHCLECDLEKDYGHG